MNFWVISLFIFTMWAVPFLIVFYYIKQQRARPPHRLNLDVHFWVWVRREEDEEKEEEEEEKFEFNENKGKITLSQ